MAGVQVVGFYGMEDDGGSKDRKKENRTKGPQPRFHTAQDAFRVEGSLGAYSWDEFARHDASHGEREEEGGRGQKV